MSKRNAKRDKSRERAAPAAGLVIPEALPGILRDFSKAVLKAQPDNLVLWSAKYFGELAETLEGGERRKDDERIHLGSDGGRHDSAFTLPSDEGNPLTQQALCRVSEKLGGGDYVLWSEVEAAWAEEGLKESELQRAKGKGDLASAVDVLHRLHFLTAAASLLAKTPRETLALVAEACSAASGPGGGLSGAEAAVAAEFLAEAEGLEAKDLKDAAAQAAKRAKGPLRASAIRASRFPDI